MSQQENRNMTRDGAVLYSWKRVRRDNELSKQFPRAAQKVPLTYQVLEKHFSSEKSKLTEGCHDIVEGEDGQCALGNKFHSKGSRGDVE